MPRPRDSYCGRVYKAERQALTDYPADQFKTLEQTEEFIRSVLASQWRKKHYPSCAILTVTCRKGTIDATGGRTRINLPRWAWNKRVALHETAHYLLCQSEEYRRHRASHGREFCKLFLEMVSRFYDQEAAKRLRAQFVALRIPYRAKKRITPELAAQLQTRGRELARFRKNGE